MTVFRLEYSKLFGMKMDGLLHPVFPVTVHYQICPSALLSARNLPCNSLDVIFKTGRTGRILACGWRNGLLPLWIKCSSFWRNADCHVILKSV